MSSEDSMSMGGGNRQGKKDKVSGDKYSRLKDELRKVKAARTIEREEWDNVRKVAETEWKGREDSLMRKSEHDRLEWAQKEKKYCNTVFRLAKSAENRNKFHGRNKMSKSSFDGYDHANVSSISNLLKFVVLPHLKFLHESWTQYAPDDRNSFSFRLCREVDFPEDCLKSVFWEDSLVPLTNKKLIDWRSNSNGGVGGQYKGK